MRIVPKNWRDFQHYKDRNPPWIRLHKTLLDNFDFQRLPVASRALAPMLWLLASDSTDGVIDATPERLAFRLRQPERDIIAALKPLIDMGFFSVVRDASAPLAEREQVAVPETEALQSTETETETEAPARKRATPPTCPEGVEPQVWTDWLSLRKSKKAPVTATVIASATKEASKAGMTLTAFLTVWCARGSQGLQADWLKPHERAVGHGSASTEPEWRRQQRERNEAFYGPAAASRQQPTTLTAEEVDDIPLALD